MIKMTCPCCGQNVYFSEDGKKLSSFELYENQKLAEVKARELGYEFGIESGGETDE